MQSIPPIDCPSDGVDYHGQRQPIDGHFPVGPGLLDRQPSQHGQQHVISQHYLPLTGPANGDPAFPGHQPPKHVDPVREQRSSFSIIHPGGPGFHGQQQPSNINTPGAQVCPGQQLPKVEEMLLSCAMVMSQITQQQQHIQQQLQQAFSPAAASATENAMAAAPSPSAHPAKEVVMQQHQFEPAQANKPRMAHGRVTIISVVYSNTIITPHLIDCPASAATTRTSAASDGEGESTCDVTRDDHEQWKLVRVSERPCHQFRLKLPNSPNGHIPAQNFTSGDIIVQQRRQRIMRWKQTTTKFSTFVAIGATQQHPLSKGSLHRIVNNGQWFGPGNNKSSANHPTPWPPPTRSICSLEVIVNIDRGGRHSAQFSSGTKKKKWQLVFIRLNRASLENRCSLATLDRPSHRGADCASAVEELMQLFDPVQSQSPVQINHARAAFTSQRVS